MTGRKYSVLEINDLRHVVEREYLYGYFTVPPTGSFTGKSYKEYGDVARVVEARVQTYMLAGLTADDLRQSEKG